MAGGDISLVLGMLERIRGEETDMSWIIDSISRESGVLLLFESYTLCIAVGTQEHGSVRQLAFLGTGSFRTGWRMGVKRIEIHTYVPSDLHRYLDT